MELGMIGLGRMGANMTQRLIPGGHCVVGFDFKPEARKRVEQDGAESVASLDALAAKLAAPRTLWMMVPSGDATEATAHALLHCYRRATPSSTAAIQTTRTRSDARDSSPSGN